jgi:hypothetical protein
MTPFSLRPAANTYTLYDQQRPVCPVSLPTRPTWYDRHTTSGILATRIATLRADRLSVTLVKDCVYFATGSHCRFCAIKYNPTNEIVNKRVNDIAEIVRYSIEEPRCAASHIYFNLGNTEHPDRGLETYEELVQAIRPISSIPIHLNQTAPRDSSYIRELHKIGFDEISFNIEFVDQSVSARIMPGKHAEIGLEHTLRPGTGTAAAVRGGRAKGVVRVSTHA